MYFRNGFYRTLLFIYDNEYHRLIKLHKPSTFNIFIFIRCTGCTRNTTLLTIYTYTYNLEITRDIGELLKHKWLESSLK